MRPSSFISLSQACSTYNLWTLPWSFSPNFHSMISWLCTWKSCLWLQLSSLFSVHGRIKWLALKRSTSFSLYTLLASIRSHTQISSLAPYNHWDLAATILILFTTKWLILSREISSKVWCLPLPSSAITISSVRYKSSLYLLWLRFIWLRFSRSKTRSSRLIIK